MYPQQPQYPGGPAAYPMTGQPQMPAYPYPGQVSGPASPGLPQMPAMATPNGAPVPSMPALRDVVVGGGAGTPAVAELAGRAVICVPTAYDQNAKGLNPADPIRPSVTMDVYVLDGPLPFMSGAAPKANPPRPNPTHRTDALPALFRGVMSSNVNIVRALKDSVGTGVVVGRIVQGVGTKGSPPWNLAPLDDSQPADAQARAIAQRVHTDVNAGTFQNPTPVEIAPAQPAGPSPAYAAAVQYPQAQPTQPHSAAAAPPGFPPGLWAQMSPQQQSEYLASVGQAAHPAAAPAQAGPPMPYGY